MKERRVSKRVRLARYLKVFERNTEAFIGHMVDVQVGGMLLVSERPILPGTRMELGLEILSEIMPLSLEAVWFEEDPRLESYNIGCRLVDLPPETESRIQALVSALETRN
jgi:hypothetical protein